VGLVGPPASLEHRLPGFTPALQPAPSSITLRLFYTKYGNTGLSSSISSEMCALRQGLGAGGGMEGAAVLEVQVPGAEGCLLQGAELENSLLPVVSPSHVVSAAPSSSGEDSSHSAPAPA